ncbi:MAG TPA: RNA-binding protein [Candidatus Eremiobacteraeota bacterium]|nr:RNA-binding protein [Candidatus Eremiobacteraeota bacterium]
MSKKIYVGNLSYDTDESSLGEIFSEFGNVESVRIITNRDTGTSKGFGFVEMAEEEEANAAIAGLNEKEIEGRKIVVSEAREKQDRRRGGFGGGGGRSHNGGDRSFGRSQRRY